MHSKHNIENDFRKNKNHQISFRINKNYTIQTLSNNKEIEPR